MVHPYLDFGGGGPLARSRSAIHQRENYGQWSLFHASCDWSPAYDWCIL